LGELFAALAFVLFADSAFGAVCGFCPPAATFPVAPLAGVEGDCAFVTGGTGAFEAAPGFAGFSGVVFCSPAG
jgi:hypothetical protein